MQSNQAAGYGLVDAHEGDLTVTASFIHWFVCGRCLR
jgi:hypothetical protein